jgi:2-dehydro-3-deoxy-L-fuconate 4-dehydrogenase
MSRRLDGKIAVVTAAGQGIGKASAERLASEGARVFATDINSNALSSFTACETFALDVTHDAAIREFAQITGPVDILFNCAGYVHAGTVLDCDAGDWTRSLDINITAMYHMVRAFLPAMIAKHSGSIINMSSAISSVRGMTSRFAYGTTKAAVIGLTKSVAVDFVKRGIRCNAICPGMVQTPSMRDRIEVAADREQRSAAEVEQAFVDRLPSGRMATVDEIAALVAYLASDESAYTTGTIQLIDGGWSA